MQVLAALSCKVYLMETNNDVEQPDVVAVKPLRRYKLWVEFEDGIRGCVKVTSELKTGAIYPATERGGGCSTEPAPWGDVLWRGEIELSAEAIRERLALSG